MTEYNEKIIACPYCGHEHERRESCLGRLGEVVFHRCRQCHGDFSFTIRAGVAAEDEYWEAEL